MEVNSPNQPETSTQPHPVQTPVINQKGFFPIILGVLVLLLVVGGGAYYLGTQNKSTKQSSVNTPSLTISTQQNNVDTSPASSNASIPTNWKTYNNTKYSYSVSFPSALEATNSERGTIVNAENSDSVMFDYPNPDFGIPPYYISVTSESQGSTGNFGTYGTLSQPTLDKIFALKVGEELDKKTSEHIIGSSEVPTNYKRLPDETVNGLNFIGIEIPAWYTGSSGSISHRILFLRKNGKIYSTGITYHKDDQDRLKEFQQFYSSLTFNK